MAITLRPTAGTKCYVDAAAPATFDETGFDALTFANEVEGFDQIGEVGDEDSVQQFESLTDGIIKYRGLNDPGQIDVNIADDPSDAGQAILAAAKAAARGSSGEKVSMKFVDEAGYGVYCQVLVSSWKRNYGGGNDVQRRTAVLPIIVGTIVEFEPEE